MNDNDTLAELKATQALLQKAHDYIEFHGYDIGTYLGDGGQGGARCFIGTVRSVAGLYAGPGNDAGYGNGPELRRALQALDRVAKFELPIRNNDGYNQESILEEYNTGNDAGRYVEALGFSKEKMSEEEQRDFALATFRDALTEVYKMIQTVSA